MAARRYVFTIKMPARAVRRFDRLALELIRKHPSLNLLDARARVLVAIARRVLRPTEGKPARLRRSAGKVAKPKAA